MINKSNLVCQSWMRTELGLKGEELMTYALIWGFSQDGQSCFYGSFAYVMEWVGCSRRTAIRLLQKLEEKGLIRKWQEDVNGVAHNRYMAVMDNDGYATSVHEKDAQNDTGDKMALVTKTTETPCQNGTQVVTNWHTSNKPSIKYNTKPRARGCEEIKSADTPAEVFNNFANGNQELLKSLMEFDEYRRQLAAKDKRKQWSALAARKICKSLVRLTKEAGVQDRIGYMIAMLDQSIESSWTGVFAVKDFVDRIPEAPRRAAEPDKPRIVTSETTLEELLGGAT